MSTAIEDAGRRESGRVQSEQWNRVCSRRSAMIGALGGFGAVLLGRAVAAQGTAPGVTRGDCGQLPGLQLLLDWRAGKPVMSHDDLLPPAGWALYNLPGMPVVFLYPGDWTASAMWASALTPSGAVAWQSVPSPTAYLVGARIVSPKNNAVYEYVSGVLNGVALTLGDAASAAEQGVLGDRRTTEPICLYEDTTSLTHAWTRAGRYGDLAVATGGNVYSDAGAFTPYTLINYQSFVGPEKTFTELMRSVCIPIMFQLLMSGSSAVTPTPTPDI